MDVSNLLNPKVASSSPPVASTATAAASAAHASAGQITGDNKNLITRAGLSRTHQFAIHHLGNWLKDNGRGTLADILNSTSSTYGNENVVSWLDLPADQNYYGRDYKRQNRSGGNGGGAVTAFRRAFGKID
jgi:hypothetical protein